MSERKHYRPMIKMPEFNPERDYHTCLEIVRKRVDSGYFNLALEGPEEYLGYPVAISMLLPINIIEESARFYLVDRCNVDIYPQKLHFYKSKIIGYKKSNPAIQEIENILLEKHQITPDQYPKLWKSEILRLALIKDNYPLSFILFGKTKGENHVNNAHLYFPASIPPSYALERIQESIKLSVAQKN